MTLALSILLLCNAVWNVVVWPRFFARVAADPRARAEDGSTTAFWRVHAVLVGIALLLAALSAVAGVWGLVAGA
ncbi:SCO4848 family membrane protein [Mycetocola reblochoni]|uniref:Integral membrane protein n=2 Tax=Mycetocola reblochoni TaxID=331618 RepID=A0A3L6ZSF5_9MICO|nr:hypothetical protein [Mycetocola reblochoni]RLP69962.1 hypothetical protein D9V30_04590 [Mycetocola reblochoni]SJN29812.1 putative integral membrane protein [Mycetocola reblochoni REB411]